MLLTGIVLASLATPTPTVVDHPALHPAGVDLYLEIPDVGACVTAGAASPAARFVADPDVQKLGALTQQIGYDLGALVRSAMPRLGAEKDDTRLFATGELHAVSISWSGLDRGPEDPPDASARAGVFMVCDFASDAGAERMSTALHAAGWLADRTDASTPSTEGAAKPPIEILRADGPALTLERHRLNAFFLHLDAWSTRQGSRWILGAGTATPAAFLERTSGKAAHLADHATLFAAEKDFTPTSGTVFARLYADLESNPLASIAGDSPFLGAAVTTLFPFVGARGVWRVELRGDRFVTESSYRRLVPATPFDDLYGAAPVTRASAEYLPREAVGAWIVRVDPKKLGPALGRLLAQEGTSTNGSTSADGAKAAAELERALGTNASFAMLPLANVQSLVPRVLVTFELVDRAAFQEGLAALVADLKARKPSLTVEERPYHKIPLTIFSDGAVKEDAAPATSGDANPLAGMMGGDSMRPAIAVLQDRVIVGLSPTHVRSEIQRLEKKPVDGAAPERHALALDGRFPADAIEASSLDWAGFVGKLYDTARGFAPMLAQGRELPFDPATLPSSSTFTRFFQPSFAWTTKSERGLYTRSESSFGPETLVTLAALFAGISRSQDGGGAGLLGGGAIGARPEPPNKKDAEPASTTKKDATAAPAKDEAREKTIASLRAVKTGLAVYRAQAEHYPDTLAALLVGTDSFPKGFLDPPEIPKDAWSHELRYALEPGGAKYKLWSLGRDGVDQHGSGDDVLAP